MFTLKESFLEDCTRPFPRCCYKILREHIREEFFSLMGSEDFTPSTLVWLETSWSHHGDRHEAEGAGLEELGSDLKDLVPTTSI